MARGTPFRFEGFGRGYNPLDAPMSVPEAGDGARVGMGAYDCLNVTTDQHGRRLLPRWGSSAIVFGGTSFTTATGLSIVPGSTANLAITSENGSTLKTVNGTTGAVTTPTGGSVASGGAFTWLRLPAIGGQGPLYGMNGSVAKYMDAAGSAAGAWTATTGTLPIGTMMVYANNRLWVSGVPGSPYSVYFSEIGDPTNWPAANVVQFSPSDGLPVTGIQACGPYLLVFKSRSIWKIYDLDIGANTQITSEFGTLASRALPVMGDRCYFLDPRIGLAVTDATNTRAVGASARPLLDAAAGSLAGSGGSSAVAIGDRLYWSVVKFSVTYPGGVRTIASSVLNFEYVPEFDSIWPHSSTYTDFAVNTTSGTSSALGSLWGLSPQVGFNPYSVMSIWGIGQDVGSRVASGGTYRWRGPFHRFSKDGLHKRVRRISFDGTGTVTVSYQTDFRVTDEPTLGAVVNMTPSAATGTPQTPPVGVSPLGEAEVYSLGTMRSVSLTITGDLSSRFELDGYTIYADGRRD